MVRRQLSQNVRQGEGHAAPPQRLPGGCRLRKNQTPGNGWMQRESQVQDSPEKAEGGLEVASTLSPALTGFSRRQVRSTTETLGVGTRKAIPVSFLCETRVSRRSRPQPSASPPFCGRYVRAGQAPTAAA